MSLHARPGNWIVQIDADEILLNAEEFRRWLTFVEGRAQDVGATWLTVFKTFGRRALVIDPPQEVTPIATIYAGHYTAARETGRKFAISPLRLLHYSWGRTPDELRQKLRNWSHSQDFDT